MILSTIRHSIHDVRKRVVKDDKFAQRMMGIKDNKLRGGNALLYLDKISDNKNTHANSTHEFEEKKPKRPSSAAEINNNFSDVYSSDEEDNSDLSKLIKHSNRSRSSYIYSGVIELLKRAACCRTMSKKSGRA